MHDIIKAMIKVLMFYFKYNVYNSFSFRVLKFLLLKVKKLGLFAQFLDGA